MEDRGQALPNFDEKLATTLTHLRAVLETVNGGILLTSGDGKTVLWANQQIGDFFGVPDLAAATSSPGQTQELIQQFQACLPTKSEDVVDRVNFSGLTREIELNHPQRRFLQQSTTPLYGAQGEYIGRLWVYHDITNDRRMEVQLRQTQKMESLGRLAGGIAHDFNNILGGILGFTDLALEDGLSDSDRVSHLQQVQQAARRGASLVRQLLAFTNSGLPVLESVGLNELVTEMLPFLKRLTGDSVELGLALSENLDLVQADPHQLEQVLMNLVVNARDALPQGGKITIATANFTAEESNPRLHEIPPGRYIMLTVEDTGVGMTSESKARLFEPFFTTKPMGEGSGLGLYICYGIIKRCGGHIEVDSQEGQGTTFTIYLPSTAGIDRPTNSMQVDSEQGSDSDTLAGHEKVMVVDDNPVMRNLISHVLQGLGYRVLIANNGEDGLSVIRQNGHEPIDLLVTDLVMPYMDGVELTDRVRRIYPNIKVIMISGYADLIDTKHFATLQIRFLQKPFMPHALAVILREMLDHKQV